MSTDPTPFDRMPGAEENFVGTCNQMGFMTTRPDPFSQRLIDHASSQALPMLEIGAAYGVATLPALQRGTQVIANDLSAQQLDVLRDMAPAESQRRLRLMPGAFPQALSLEKASLSAVLACRVFHFFDGDTIRNGLARIFDWLSTGGKLCIVAETVYVRTMQPFIPLYESRVLQAEEWPGYFDNIHQLCPPELVDKLPSAMHYLDETVMRREMERAGFEVEICETLDRTDFPDWLRLDGRESVGIIGRKPG